MANPNIAKDSPKTWKKGQSGNPNGRPKGLSITALVREELEKVPEGQKEKAKLLLVKRILHKAISEGEFKYAQEIWRQFDGAPKQKAELTGKDGEPLVIPAPLHGKYKPDSSPGDDSK